MPHLTPDGNYTDSPYVADGSIEVPERPSIAHKWNGAAWAIPPRTYEQQISDRLAQLPMPMNRAQVQTAIVACEAYAKANGLTLPFLYAHTKLYKLTKDAEADCTVIDAAFP